MKWESGKKVEINQEMDLARTNDDSTLRAETDNQLNSLCTWFPPKGAVACGCLEESKPFSTELAVLSA